ncbi:unnamed protein product [Dracunculus medinensis]|uniref:RNA polymerase II nuclear localization protein SLC7A6OS n=1 Tax=Dracunculus medinensis TaxID=318479 RepID=A0A0N4UQL6_DRAME|nr:unnamed protein product [Dracunculus medinensis]
MARRNSGRGSTRTGLNAVANALGISRNDLNSMSASVHEVPQTFPPLSKTLIPLEIFDSVQYEIDLKLELATRFRESSFYLERKNDKVGDIRRYTDKYRKIAIEKFKPDWSRLPSELRWEKKNLSEKPPKKRVKMIDEGTNEVLANLDKIDDFDEGSSDDESEDDADKDSKEVRLDMDQNFWWRMLYTSSLLEEIFILSDFNNFFSTKLADNHSRNFDISIFLQKYDENEEGMPSDEEGDDDNDYTYSYFDNGESYLSDDAI